MLRKINKKQFINPLDNSNSSICSDEETKQSKKAFIEDNKNIE